MATHAQRASVEPGGEFVATKPPAPTKLVVLAIALAVVFFLVDVSVPLGVAAGAPYVVLVLVGLWFPQHRAVLWLAAAGSVLTIVGYFLSDPAGIQWMVLANRGLALFAIWATAILAYQRLCAEEQVRRHQQTLAHILRMYTVDEMTIGLAHELNQPLAAIAAFCDAGLRILRSKGDEEKLAYALEQSQSQAHHAGKIINRLRDLLRKPEGVKQHTDVSALVANVAALVANEARDKRIEMRFRLAPHLPRIFVDHVQIEQVLLNLVRNAIEAIDSAATEHRQVTICADPAGEDSVTVVVEDTGPGLDVEIRALVFDAFYSTKVEGMGMGLAISRSIVEAHGGKLWTESMPGAGASFQFSLPAAAA